VTKRCLTALAVALAACRAGAAEGGYSVRDSAGVQIVSNPASVAGDSGCVAVDSVPSVTIGGADAEGPYDLVQVGGVLRLADGEVVALNASTSELRFFDPSGRHLRSVGRKGSGPGEFQNPSALLWYGADTLMVRDFATGRITLLGADGRLLEEVSLRGAPAGQLLGRMPDGSFLFSAGRTIRPGAEASGRSRSPVHLVRVSRRGEVLDTLGSFPGRESLIEASERSVMVGPALYGRSTTFAVRGSTLFVGDNAEYRVRAYSDGRRLERIVAREHSPEPLAAEVVERDRARRAAALTDARFRERLERMYQRDRLPEFLPAFGELVVDAQGWLWVSAYATASEGPRAWDVFDDSGRLRCALSLPAALSVQEIGRAFVLGVFRDEDGVEHVRLYGLRRGVRPTS